MNEMVDESLWTTDFLWGEKPSDTESAQTVRNSLERICTTIMCFGEHRVCTPLELAFLPSKVMKEVRKKTNILEELNSDTLWLCTYDDGTWGVEYECTFNVIEEDAD